MFRDQQHEHLQRLSKLLTGGSTENRQKALTSLSLMNYDPQAEVILQAELARIENNDPILASALAGFITASNIQFLGHLFLTGKHHIVQEIFLQMHELIMEELIHSINPCGIEILLNNPDPHDLESLFGTHPMWDQYIFLLEFWGTHADMTGPFTTWAGKLKTVRANSSLRQCIKDEDQDGMIEHIVWASGELFVQAYKILAACKHPRLEQRFAEKQKIFGPLVLKPEAE
jgi:hypothetical protein